MSRQQRQDSSGLVVGKHSRRGTGERVNQAIQLVVGGLKHLAVGLEDIAKESGRKYMSDY